MKADKLIEALTNVLRDNTTDESLFIQKADVRLGVKFAIAKEIDGALHILTDYVSYKEMYYLLVGVQMAKNNKL